MNNSNLMKTLNELVDTNLAAEPEVDMSSGSDEQYQTSNYLGMQGMTYDDFGTYFRRKLHNVIGVDLTATDFDSVPFIAHTNNQIAQAIVSDSDADKPFIYVLKFEGNNDSIDSDIRVVQRVFVMTNIDRFAKQLDPQARHLKNHVYVVSNINADPFVETIFANLGSIAMFLRDNKLGKLFTHKLILKPDAAARSKVDLDVVPSKDKIGKKEEPIEEPVEPELEVEESYELMTATITEDLVSPTIWGDMDIVFKKGDSVEYKQVNETQCKIIHADNSYLVDLEYVGISGS